MPRHDSLATLRVDLHLQLPVALLVELDLERQDVGEVLELDRVRQAGDDARTQLRRPLRAVDAALRGAERHLAAVLRVVQQLSHLLEHGGKVAVVRPEEHTSELQTLMRISYAVFSLQKKKKQK